MDNPLITVVVPIYNVELYLERCIKSVVSQTYKNIEIILVDDGSPDGCGKICDEWKDKDLRIKVIHKANEGLGMARNTGMENATGKYIFFFDSDDYVAPDTVEKCVFKAESDKSDTVLFGRNEVYPDGKTKGTTVKFPKSVFEADEIQTVILPGLFNYMFGYGISSCMKMFSMDIIRSNDLRFHSEREIISEDAFFCIEYFSKSKRVSCLADNLYYYFKNYTSLSRTYSSDRQKKNNIFLLKSEEKIKELKLPNIVLLYLKSKYQIYSLAAMKHIVNSDMTKSEKKAELRNIYKDKTFLSTIKTDVLRVSSKTMVIFMLCIKLKLYFISDILLKCKA